MFVPLRAGYDIANQGVKSYQAAEIGGRASSDRAVGVDHDSAAAKKNFGPQRCQGPNRFLRRAPFLDDRVDAFGHQDGDAAEETKPNIARPTQNVIDQDQAMLKKEPGDWRKLNPTVIACD
jgi:hypothetical protein